MKFNYNKLKGRIREYFGSQTNFAKSLNLSNVSLSHKLNNRVFFTQEEIAMMIERLNVQDIEIKDIFFIKEV